MVFRPLAGCGLFPGDDGRGAGGLGFRPLAGCGLFLFETDSLKAAKAVSVPLRGVGCFRKERRSRNGSFRPLAGCGLFHTMRKENNLSYWFPSPCGVWIVSIWLAILKQRSTKFPSPCGVWVVSITPIIPSYNP